MNSSWHITQWANTRSSSSVVSVTWKDWLTMGGKGGGWFYLYTLSQLNIPWTPSLLSHPQHYYIQSHIRLPHSTFSQCTSKTLSPQTSPSTNLPNPQAHSSLDFGCWPFFTPVVSFSKPRKGNIFVMQRRRTSTLCTRCSCGPTVYIYIKDSEEQVFGSNDCNRSNIRIHFSAQP